MVQHVYDENIFSVTYISNSRAHNARANYKPNFRNLDLEELRKTPFSHFLILAYRKVNAVPGYFISAPFRYSNKTSSFLSKATVDRL